MPRPYSSDLRSRVIAACEEGERPSAVARRFRVARASVYLWLQQWREEGRCQAKRHCGGPKPVIHDETEAALIRLVQADNDLTLAEYRDRLAEETRVRVHPWTIGRALQRLAWTRKKEGLARHRARRGRGRRCAPGLVARAAGLPR
jgi:transposase